MWTQPTSWIHLNSSSLAIKTPHSCISSLNDLGLCLGNWLRRSWRDVRRRRSWRRWTVKLCGRRRSWELSNRRSRTSRRRCSRTNALWNLRWEALTTTHSICRFIVSFSGLPFFYLLPLADSIGSNVILVLFYLYELLGYFFSNFIMCFCQFILFCCCF